MDWKSVAAIFGCLLAVTKAIDLWRIARLEKRAAVADELLKLTNSISQLSFRYLNLMDRHSGDNSVLDILRGMESRAKHTREKVCEVTAMFSEGKRLPMLTTLYEHELIVKTMQAELEEMISQFDQVHVKKEPGF